MATKRDKVRADGTYFITKDKGANPKLGARVMSDGTEHLFLEYYLGYDNSTKKVSRKREYLRGMFLFRNPNPIQKQLNDETLLTAQKMRAELQVRFIEDANSVTFSREKKRINFLSYMEQYQEEYAKKDIRMIRFAIKKFKEFLESKPAYNRYAKYLAPSDLSKDMMVAFADHLQATGKGEGPKSTWARFKRIVNYAVEHNVLKESPCKGITVKIDDNALTKDVLTAEEWSQLLATHYPQESQTIRKAAIFSYYTGLRWCDVSTITYGAIDYQAKTFTIDQAKTKGHCDKSKVTNPLSDELIEMIGRPQTTNPSTERLFDLKSYEASCKALKRWVKRAGTDKHISWHCLRHSVATELLRQGENIKVVADYLGHSKLNFVNKYVRALAEDKHKALTKLPRLSFAQPGTAPGAEDGHQPSSR
ncbi:MAG: site-specific integrase [Bacteroidales bacterium]|nr:site-specific integrase [Bacteroidales bacterium]